MEVILTQKSVDRYVRNEDYMDNEKIKTYSYRIQQATRSQLVVITYDIIIEYLDEALAFKNAVEYKESIHMAMRGIDNLITGLDMRYEVSIELYRLYNYMKRTLISAQVSCDCDKVREVRGLLDKLKNAFSEVSRQDLSAPLRKNTEQRYSGLTYSRYGANEVAQDTLSNRGYKV